MKYGIVGNRIGWTYSEVKLFLDTLNIRESDVIISGGAQGVDSYAEQYAKEKSIEFSVYYPVLSEPIPLRYFNRNRNIALDCDVLVAFDKKKGASGTKNTIKYAKMLNKLVILRDY